MPYAIESNQLVRTFGGAKGKKPLVALDRVDLQVEEGELFGLLGPNGAGKTTLIKILATLLLPSSGTVKVLGHDVEKEAQAIRPRINMVSGGETSREWGIIRSSSMPATPSPSKGSPERSLISSCAIASPPSPSRAKDMSP